MWKLLVLLSITIVSARFYCGVDPVTNLAMEAYIKLDCNQRFAQHRDCCQEHGFCYLRRNPGGDCDNQYCICVQALAEDGVCRFHADNFCNNVRTNGPNIYPMFTMENGRK